MSVFIHSKKRTDDLFNDMWYNKTIDWKIKFVVNIYNTAGIAWKERGGYMQQFDRYYSLIFHVDDKLTEDANTMIDEQKNKSKCIRTILLDFVRVNGIVNNYTDIPEKERLERFFGCSAYSGKVANISKFVSAMKGYIMYLLTLFIQHRMEKRSASQSDINTVVKLT